MTDRPKELPRAPVMQSSTVQAAQREHRVARQNKERRAIAIMASFVGWGGFSTFLDKMFGAGPAKGERGFTVSKCTSEKVRFADRMRRRRQLQN